MHTSKFLKFAAFTLLASTTSATMDLCASPLITEKVIGDYVFPIDSDSKYRVYMCDFCDQDLDQRFRKLIDKSHYEGEWYAVDIPYGEVRRYIVHRNAGQIVIRDEPVDEETRKYVKANQELFNANKKSYNVNLTINVDLPKK